MKQCTTCGKFLKTTAGLKIHMTRVHKQVVDDQKFNNSHSDIIDLITDQINQRVIYPVIDFIERMEQKLSGPVGVMMYNIPPENTEEGLWRNQDLKNQKIILRTGAPMETIILRQTLQDELKENERFKELSAL